MAFTYEPIATYTLSSSAQSYTFSSIPGTYTDLILIVSAFNTSGNASYRIYYNGDTANNYSAAYMEGDGNGGAPYSSRWSSRADIPFARGASSTVPDVITTSLNNYSNTSTFKTSLSRYSLGSTLGKRTSATVGLWRSTAAITSITVTTGDATSMGSGSMFTLYGIAAA